jgi:hypothetical protein
MKIVFFKISQGIKIYLIDKDGACSQEVNTLQK